MKFKIEDYGHVLYATKGAVVADAQKITSGEHRRKWYVRHNGRTEIVANKATARRRLRDLAGGAS